MHVTRYGQDDAPPVLLLHGGGVAGWMWDSLQRRLAGGHHVVIPDLPGHGRSAGEPYVSHADTTTALARLLAEVTRDRPAAVVGFSLGAQLALRLAAERPDLIDRAVIVSAQALPMRLSGAALRMVDASAPLARVRWFATLQSRQLFIPRELREAYIRDSALVSRQTLRAALTENLGFEIPTAWSHFPGRTLVLAGSRERRLMRDSAAAIHAALPGSELELVAGCGHGIPLQRPEWFDQRVADWVAT